MMKINVLILFILFSLGLSAQQHGHKDEEEENEKAMFKHTPQHGGEIVEAGKYKLEIITHPMQTHEKLMVYLLKKNYKEIVPDAASASIVVKYKNGATDSLEMDWHENRFSTNKVDLMRPVNIKFTIRINDRTVIGHYYYQGLTTK